MYDSKNGFDPADNKLSIDSWSKTGSLNCAVASSPATFSASGSSMGSCASFWASRAARPLCSYASWWVWGHCFKQLCIRLSGGSQTKNGFEWNVLWSLTFRVCMKSVEGPYTPSTEISVRLHFWMNTNTVILKVKSPRYENFSLNFNFGMLNFKHMLPVFIQKMQLNLKLEVFERNYSFENRKKQ